MTKKTTYYRWKDQSLQEQVYFMGFGEVGLYCKGDLPNDCFEFIAHEYGKELDLQKFVTQIKNMMIEDSKDILIPENVKLRIINDCLDNSIETISRSYKHRNSKDINLSKCDIGALNVIKRDQIMCNVRFGVYYFDEEYADRDYFPEISKYIKNIDGYDSFRLWVALFVCKEANHYLRIFEVGGLKGYH